MFYAILPTAPAVFLVQPDATEITDAERAALLSDLGRHFMSAVALIWWDWGGQFHTAGHPCTAEQASDEALTWREFSLPTKSDELPF